MPNHKTTDLSESIAKSLLPKRDAAAHKWSVGGVVIVAGSPDYPGAALLAARAAGRSGAGIVVLASTRSVTSMVAGSIPEVAHVAFGETESHSGAHRAAESIAKAAEKAKSIVIGPGLGSDASTDGLLSALFGFGGKAESSRGRIGFGVEADKATAESAANSGVIAGTDLKIVIDADGLNWLARQSEWWTKLPESRVVLTPHPGEMARLLDKPVEDVIADPEGVAVDAATRWKQVVLLKGAQPVVTDGKTTYLGAAARPSLATAGSGDVLAGTVGAFLAQTSYLLESAALAATVGPIAAAAIEEEFGVAGLIASDLPDAIARTIARLSS